MRLRRSCAFIAAVAALLAAGCVKTTQVGDDVNATKLVSDNKAVAVMRLGSSNPNCKHVSVLLGVREGDGFKRAQPVTVANVRNLADAAVAEVALDPGEYHIVAYSCSTEKGPTVIADKTAGPGLISIPYYRTSYAHFALGPGEIVNVGFVHLEAAKKMRSAFGTALAPELTVSEWGLEDIERFKRTRPQIAAQLTTRLMTVAGGPASPEEKRDTCARWRKAKADGLAQAVPTECAAPTPAAAANMPAPSPQ